MIWKTLKTKLHTKRQQLPSRSRDIRRKAFIAKVGWFSYLFESILFPIWSILLNSKVAKSPLTYISFGLTTASAIPLLYAVWSNDNLSARSRMRQTWSFRTVVLLSILVIHGTFKMILYDITVEQKEYLYVCIMEILIVLMWFYRNTSIQREAMALVITFLLYGLLSNVISREPSEVLIAQYVIVIVVLGIACYSQVPSKDVTPGMTRKLTLVEQKRVWEDHLGCISDLILIVDGEGQMIFANKAYQKMCQEEGISADEFGLIRQMTRLKLAESNNEEFNKWIQGKHSGNSSIFRSLSTNKFVALQTSTSDADPLGRKFTRKQSKHRTLPLAIDLDVLIGIISKNIDEYSKVMNNRELVVYGKFHKEKVGWSSFEIKITISSEGEQLVLFILITETTHRDKVLQLEEINNFKNQLLGSISHEMRTPLNSNKIFLEVAENSSKIPHEMLEDIIKPIAVSTRLLEYLLDDILDLSRLELKTLTLKYTTEKLHQSLMNTVDIFKFQLKAKRCKIFLDVPHDVPHEIKTDFQRLNRVLVNLLHISVASTSKDTITIKVEVADNCINIFVGGKGILYSQEEIEQIKTILKGRMAKTPKDEISDKYLRLHLATKLAQALNQRGSKEGVKFESDAHGSTYSFKVEMILDEEENQREINFSEQDIDVEGNRGMTKMLSRAGTTKQFTKILTRNEGNIERRISLSPRSEKISHDTITEEQNLKREEIIDPRDVGMDQIISHRHKVPYQSAATTIQPITKTLEEGEDELGFELNYMSQECTCHVALIVDDEIFNVKSLEKLLTSMYNLPCEEAYNGKSALEKIYGKKRCCRKCKIYSIIFLDCNMPIQDGFTTAELLKKDMRERDEIDSSESDEEAKKLPHIPIVACTAYVASQQAMRCKELGIDEYMEKPLDKKQLLEILKKYNVIRCNQYINV